MKKCAAAWLRAIRYSSFVIFLGVLFPALAFSQSANRWLLIYNTSGSMRDRVDGVEAVTQDLLSTAMHGNLRAGDTIGIWTYSDQLHADEAPLLTWSPDDARSMTEKVLQFVSRHPYEKSAAFGDVLVNMMRVVKMSDEITIVLISDANDPIKGTPFDERLSAFYKANFQQQRKVRMPVVTVFRGEHGVLTTNTFALAPWPADIPAVPPPVVAKVAPARPAAPPASRPVPSLVIVGKKAETTFKPASQLPDPTDVPADVAAQTAAATPAPAQPKPEVPKAEVPTPAPKVEEIPKVAAPAVAAEPTPAPATAQMTKAAEPAPTPTPVTAAAPNTAVKPAAPVASSVVETAAAELQPNLFSVRNIAIASVAFTVLVCALLLLAARNARNASRASLISRSLDRERQ